MKILRLADLVDVPWKNGGGVTREIATARQGDQTIWRISRADVAQDGAFSNFAGMTRILTVVSGTGMALEHEGGVLRADPWVPVQFDGALPVFSHLDAGPLTDLNLMFDPVRCDGSVVALHGPHTCALSCDAPDIIALHCLAGAPQIGGVELAAGDTVFVEDGPETLHLAHGDSVLKLTLHTKGQIDATRLFIAAR